MLWFHDQFVYSNRYATRELTPSQKLKSIRHNLCTTMLS